VLIHRPLEPEAARELVGRLRRAAPASFSAAIDLRASPPSLLTDRFTARPIRSPRRSSALLAEPITKLVLQHPDLPQADLHRLVGELGDGQIEACYSGAGLVEIAAAGVTKGAALAELCAELGIDRSEVIAFGDMLNDISMLAWAGRGVAVANAHAEVIAVADEVTASNDDDGVALVLERLSF